MICMIVMKADADWLPKTTDFMGKGILLEVSQDTVDKLGGIGMCYHIRRGLVIASWSILFALEWA